MTKRALYLGLEPPAPQPNVVLIHFPIIKIQPLIDCQEAQGCLQQLHLFTDIIFTSKVTVRLLASFLKENRLEKPLVRAIAVGQATAQELHKLRLAPVDVAENETAEGILELLKEKPSLHSSPFFFWPHSSLARPLIADFLKNQGIKFKECPFYTTVATDVSPLPNLEIFDIIFFSSPSTVDAFLERYGSFPEKAELKTIGSVTQAHLDKIQQVLIF